MYEPCPHVCPPKPVPIQMNRPYYGYGWRSEIKEGSSNSQDIITDRKEFCCFQQITCYKAFLRCTNKNIDEVSKKNTNVLP